MSREHFVPIGFSTICGRTYFKLHIIIFHQKTLKSPAFINVIFLVGKDTDFSEVHRCAVDSVIKTPPYNKLVWKPMVNWGGKDVYKLEKIKSRCLKLETFNFKDPDFAIYIAFPEFNWPKVTYLEELPHSS